MNKTILQRYAGLFGFATIFLWATAITVWVDWTQSNVFFVKSIGVVGTLLTSLSGIAIFLYLGYLETQLKDAEEKNAFNESQAQESKEQLQQVISLLEKERAKNVNQNA